MIRSNNYTMVATLLVFVLLVCCACEEESDYVYPPVVTELVCVQTTSDGKVATLVTDRGNNYPVENGDRITGLRADTTYRMQCIFEQKQNEQATSALIYSLKYIFSALPEPLPAESAMMTDPVDIESIWQSGDYINFSAKIKLQNKALHRYAFVNDGIVEENGIKTATITFYHDKNEDIEAYTERMYFSIPMSYYEGILSKGDVVRVKINTRKEGEKGYSYNF